MPRLRRASRRYLQQLDTADWQEPSDALATKITRLKEKIAKLGDEMRRLADIEARYSRALIMVVLLTDPDARSMATSGAAPAWSATTCRSRWRPSTI